MGTLNLNAVMDGIGVRLQTITGLRVKDYAADLGQPPAAIVGMPVEGEYDYTKRRGSDRVVLPVTILVGKVSDRAARDTLSDYIAGSGAKSVKAAIEGDRTLATAAQSLAVRFPDIDIVTLNGIEYWGAVFSVEVIS
jgi:hypothetical protein